METFIVIVIVGIAAFFVGRNLYKQFSGKGGCSCGSTTCQSQIKKNCLQTPHSINNGTSRT